MFAVKEDFKTEYCFLRYDTSLSAHKFMQLKNGLQPPCDLISRRQFILFLVFLLDCRV